MHGMPTLAELLLLILLVTSPAWIAVCAGLAIVFRWRRWRWRWFWLASPFVVVGTVVAASAIAAFMDGD